MTRAVPEWIGKSPDTAIPPRVKLRVFERQHKRCDSCERLIYGSETPEFDHIRALINGGENRESNIRALCRFCHAGKTRADVAEKSKNYSVAAAHVGVKESKQPLPGGRKSPWKKKMDGTVVPR